MSQKLMRIIKQAALAAMEEGDPVAVLYGTVVSDNPLAVNVDQRFTLTEDFLILTANVRDYQTKISLGDAGANNIAEEVTICNRLEKDEKVMLLRIQGGQEYVVLDRV